MRIHTNLIFGSFLYGIEVVVVHPLSAVMFSTGDYIAYIATLYRVIAIIRHD